jgi:hypothetical protein
MDLFYIEEIPEEQDFSLKEIEKEIKKILE